MSGIDAKSLRARYVEELRRSLLPPRHPMVNPSQTQTLIRRAECESGAAWTGADAATWIWSDLHLGHEPSVRAFGRPFRNAAEVDRAMMQAWYDQVAGNETIICLGDLTVDGAALAHHQDWWRRAPGRKHVVLGNHDVERINQMRPLKADDRTVTLHAAGDPPLLLTHVPLVELPAGTVNVHGHLHDQASPTRNRHIGVSVEQLKYRPARLSEIRRLARRLVEGRDVPGHSTRARLNVVERVMP